VAQIMAKTNKTAIAVPMSSRLMSKISLRLPDPTVSQGPANTPARNLAKIIEIMFSEEPPTQIKSRQRGVVIL